MAILLVSLNLIGPAVKHASTPTEQPGWEPLPFKVVMERLQEARMLDPREKVEALLGLPSPIRGVWESELREKFESARYSSRLVGLPRDHFWTVWSDPDNPNRGVAILFAGDKVYHLYRKGLSPRK